MEDKEKRRRILMFIVLVVFLIFLYWLLKRKKLIPSFPEFQWNTILPTLTEIHETTKEVITKEEKEHEKEIEKYIYEKYILFPLFGFAVND